MRLARRTLALILLSLLPLVVATNTARADWAETWSHIRKAAQSGTLIQIAKTRQNDPACAGALKLLDILPLLAAAMDAGRNGDALKLLSQFQNHLLCLNEESVIVVDFMLAYYAGDGTKELSEKDEDRLLRALFQLGLLTFDQNTATENSVWWMMVVGREKAFRRALENYPEDFGVYTFNVKNGTLERFNNKQADKLMMDAILNSSDLFQKKCYLGEMKDKSALPAGAGNQLDGAQMACEPRKSSNPSGSSSGASSVGGPVGGFLGCVVDVRADTGFNKQMICVENALVGVTPDISELTKFPQAKLAGIPDRACVRSEEDETGPKQAEGAKDGYHWTRPWGIALDKAIKAYKLVKNIKDVIRDPSTTKGGGGVGFNALLGIAIDLMSEDAVAAIESASSGLIEKTFDLLHAEVNVDNNEKAGLMKAEWNSLTTVEQKKQWLLKYRAAELAKKKGQQEQQKADEEGNIETKTVDPNIGGACSDRTGAAARARSLYTCISGESVLPSGATTTGPPKPPTPTVGLSVDPDGDDPMNMSGTIKALSCAVQSGDLIRTRALDTRCAKARCIEGETCACDLPNRAPSEAAAAVQAQIMTCRQIAYCAEGDCPCDPKPFADTGGTADVAPMPELPGGPIELPGTLPQPPRKNTGLPGPVP